MSKSSHFVVIFELPSPTEMSWVRHTLAGYKRATATCFIRKETRTATYGTV